MHATVFWDAGELGPSTTYRMFDVRRPTGDGAFLAGWLLLERGEEVSIELHFAAESVLRLRAQVVRVDRGDPPGVEVAWVGLSESDRRTLEERLKAEHG